MAGHCRYYTHAYHQRLGLFDQGESFIVDALVPKLRFTCAVIAWITRTDGCGMSTTGRLL